MAWMEGWDGWGWGLRNVQQGLLNRPPQSRPFLLKKPPPSTLPPSTYLSKGGGGLMGCLFKGWGGCFSFGVQTIGEYISTMFGCI